ncbi:MAG: N-acyl-D-amino-acid deacylase [Gemmatimonadales bacterium]|nr:N-acyl-D-amino-acid deacylase [Gemmatimonadales bacterium]
MADLILRGGTIVDGTGRPAREGDVVVRAGRVARLLPPGGSREEARTVVDVSGLVVAPGFIDMHAHSDLAVIEDPGHEAKVLQGVTTEVVGQDGLSYAPATPEVLDQLRVQLSGWNGNASSLDMDWTTVSGYLDRVDAGAAVNVAYLVPHGTVRLVVMGNAARPATSDELAAMRQLVAEGMRDGAVGLSTGLTYTPGSYADDAELVALCEVVAQRGGYYCPHHRNYGSTVVESYGECLSVAERARVPLHLAHCHVNFPRNRGRAREVLAAVEGARGRGLEVTLDSYPYLAGATYLHALLPGWAHEGGLVDLLDRLGEAKVRERIVHEMEVVGSDGHHGIPMDWSTIVISGVADAALERHVGRSIAQSAAAEGLRPARFFLDLLVADRLGSSCIVEVGNEENVRAILRDPEHTVGSDGILVGSRPHPRGWGSFARVLAHYVRDEGVLSLEEAVRHMTSTAARRIGLSDRGVVTEGAVADLVCFDPEAVQDNATYDDPRRAASGVVHVLVGGEPTVRDGVRTQALPGRSVRRSSGGFRSTP